MARQQLPLCSLRSVPVSDAACARTPALQSQGSRGKVLGRNCLLWQCPVRGQHAELFPRYIPLFLLLDISPVTQSTDKYMPNAPFLCEAATDACRINTGGLGVRLGQLAWGCGSALLSKSSSECTVEGWCEQSW